MEYLDSIATFIASLAALVSIFLTYRIFIWNKRETSLMQERIRNHDIKLIKIKCRIDDCYAIRSLFDKLVLDINKESGLLWRKFDEMRANQSNQFSVSFRADINSSFNILENIVHKFRNEVGIYDLYKANIKKEINAYQEGIKTLATTFFGVAKIERSDYEEKIHIALGKILDAILDMRKQILSGHHLD